MLEALEIMVGSASGVALAIGLLVLLRVRLMLRRQRERVWARITFEMTRCRVCLGSGIDVGTPFGQDPSCPACRGDGEAAYAFNAVPPCVDREAPWRG